MLLRTNSYCKLYMVVERWARAMMFLFISRQLAVEVMRRTPDLPMLVRLE
jgi:hypothetical protein